MTPEAPAAKSAVIFDMDGTLFDTEPLYCDAYRAALAEQGICLESDHYHRSLAGTTNDAIERQLACDYGQGFDVLRYRASWPNYLNQSLETAGLILQPGIEQVLVALAEKQLPMAVASSSDRADIERFLQQAGIGHHFSAIAAGDEVQRSKPDPEIFLLAADRIGIAPSRCVAVEDSNHGVAAASAAGMRVVMTPSPAGASEESRKRATVTTDVCVAVLEQLIRLSDVAGRSAS